MTQTTDNRDHRLMAIVACFAAGALFLFLWGIGRDANYGLDEKVYVTSARALIGGTSVWTPDHPPLGKSLIAIGIKIAGDTPFGWRVGSAVAGSLTLGAIMLLAYLLLGSVEYAVVAGLLTLFDNFLFVMSRMATLDSFLILFLFWGCLLFVAGVSADFERRKGNVCLMLSGTLFGLAAGCKWSALFSIAVVFAIGAILYVRRRNFNFALLLASFSVLPAIAYAATFLPFFRSMGVPFTLGNLLDAQREIYVLLKPVTGNPFINVPWFRWPFQIEPQRGLRYLVGNYAVMFGGLIALGACVWRLARSFALAELAISALYLTNLLQWLLIPRSVLYYYYYYPCALLLSLALVVALSRWERKSLFGVRMHLIPVVAAMGIFLVSYPQLAGLGAPWDTVFAFWH